MILSDLDLTQLSGTTYVIFPFGDECCTPLGYDLRIKCLLVQDEALNWNQCDSTATIQPGSSAVVICEEFVWLSHLVAATIHAKGSLSFKGLSLNSTTVDPNFSGRMIFRIYNSSKTLVDLQEGEKFATMIIHTLKTPTYMCASTRPGDLITKVLPSNASSIAQEALRGIQEENNNFHQQADKAKFRLKLGHRFSIVRSISQHFNYIIALFITIVLAVLSQYGANTLTKIGIPVATVTLLYPNVVKYLTRVRN